MKTSELEATLLRVSSFRFRVSNMSFWRKEVIQPALDREVDDAFAEQRAILERDPKNPHAYFALGTLYHFHGQPDTAIPLFVKAIELDPTYAAPHVGLGRIYAVKGLNDLAVKHAREAMRLGDRSLVEQLECFPNLK